MKSAEDLSAPLDDFEYDELDGFLLALDSDRAVQNMSELDGFVTAIVSGPEYVAPSEWLPVLWGGGERQQSGANPNFPSRAWALAPTYCNGQFCAALAFGSAWIFCCPQHTWLC